MTTAQPKICVILGSGTLVGPTRPRTLTRLCRRVAALPDRPISRRRQPGRFQIETRRVFRFDGARVQVFWRRDQSPWATIAKTGDDASIESAEATLEQFCQLVGAELGDFRVRNIVASLSTATRSSADMMTFLQQHVQAEPCIATLVSRHDMVKIKLSNGSVALFFHDTIIFTQLKTLAELDACVAWLRTCGLIAA